MFTSIIVTYRHRPRRAAKAKAQPLAITAPVIVQTKRKSRHDLPPDPEADARVAEFFARSRAFKILGVR
jgi:hypothetical protein